MHHKPGDSPAVLPSLLHLTGVGPEEEPRPVRCWWHHLSSLSGALEVFLSGNMVNTAVLMANKSLLQCCTHIVVAEAVRRCDDPLLVEERRPAPLLRPPALRAEADDDKPGRGVRLGLSICQQSTLMSLLSLVSPQSSNFWKVWPWLTIDIVHIVSWLHQVLFEHGLVRVVLISPTRTVKTFEEVLLRWLR